MHNRAVRRVVVLAVMGLVLAACGGSDESERSAPTTKTNRVLGARAGPPGDSFYEPSEGVIPGEPGEVIWARKVAASDVPARYAPALVWRILYRSRALDGRPIAVSALLFVPPTASESDDAPILALAHGTAGLADECAPSKNLETADQWLPAPGMMTRALLERYVIISTDYEGLGTPGVHPYAVAMSSARSVLDSIRAAQRLTGIGTSTDSDAVIWGYSQGGAAALVAAELAPTYAADANVAGVVAGGVAGPLEAVVPVFSGTDYAAFFVMGAAGFAAAYSDEETDAYLTDAGRAEIEAVATSGCVDELIARYRGVDLGPYVKVDPGTVEPSRSMLRENSAGVRSTTVPIFLYHGEADEQVPAIGSQLVLDAYCANGTTALRKTFPGATHFGVAPLVARDVESFIADRLAGRVAATSCQA